MSMRIAIPGRPVATLWTAHASGSRPPFNSGNAVAANADPALQKRNAGAARYQRGPDRASSARTARTKTTSSTVITIAPVGAGCDVNAQLSRSEERRVGKE